jgi:hypothetical protein
MSRRLNAESLLAIHHTHAHTHVRCLSLLHRLSLPSARDHQTQRRNVNISRVFLYSPTMIVRRTLPATVSSQARASYLALYSTLSRTRQPTRLPHGVCSCSNLKVYAYIPSINCANIRPSPSSLVRDRLQYNTRRRIFSTQSCLWSTYNRSDFSGQGFSSFYETDQPTRGPLGGTSNVGQSHVTPKALRQHLDQFVVDQDRAKVVLSVAVHEHYLRNQENQRRRDETARLEAQAQRRASAFRHPVEGSFQSHCIATPVIAFVARVSDPTR